MKPFVDATFKEIEDYVIATGETLLVYGVGEACASKSDNAMEGVKAYKYFSDVNDAQKCFVALANAGKSACADEIEFYLNEEGYIQIKDIKCLELDVQK